MELTQGQELDHELSKIRWYVRNHNLSAADLHELFNAGLVATVLSDSSLGARLPRVRELPSEK